jgi:hypothetical protein
MRHAVASCAELASDLLAGFERGADVAVTPTSEEIALSSFRAENPSAPRSHRALRPSCAWLTVWGCEAPIGAWSTQPRQFRHAPFGRLLSRVRQHAITHFHSPSILQDLIVGSSVSGTSRARRMQYPF